MRILQILLAEDNDADAFLITKALDAYRLRYVLVRACDGEQAIDIIRHLGQPGGAPCPDVLLLDLNLPRWDGAEILAEFRSREACRDVPVVIVTSADSPREKERVAALGVSHYFKKPMDIDEYMKLGDVVAKTCG